jgi:hypothetical protein
VTFPRRWRASSGCLRFLLSGVATGPAHGRVTPLTFSRTYMVTGLAPRCTVVEWNFRRSTSTSGGMSRRSTTSRDPARRTRFAAFGRQRRGTTMTSQCFRFAQIVAMSWSIVEPSQPGS